MKDHDYFIEEMLSYLKEITEKVQLLDLILACKVFEKLLCSNLKLVNVCVCTFLFAQFLSKSCLSFGEVL